MYFCKKKVMKRWIFIVIIIVSIFIVGGVYYLKPYFSPAHKLDGLKVMLHSDDTIRVGYIGDSWADGHKRVICVIDSFIQDTLGRHVDVRTAGISGLTSKNIYYGIFRNDSMRSVIEWGPDFCFVVAGINDSDRKMGARYYKENMKLIIDLLLENHITPIILEIPSYNIKYSYKRRSRNVKIQYLVSMLLTWSGMDCIKEYREIYNSLLKEHNWNDKVITIRTTDWNPDGYLDVRNLYDEGQMHLNDKGYYVLDSCIAYKIVMQLKNLSCNVNH